MTGPGIEPKISRTVGGVCNHFANGPVRGGGGDKSVGTYWYIVSDVQFKFELYYVIGWKILIVMLMCELSI